MSALKTKSSTARAAKILRDKPGRYKVDFKPNTNGSYKVAFDEKALDAGFAVLLKGGLFHRFPDGFVITKTHLELLKKEGVPYKIVKRPK